MSLVTFDGMMKDLYPAAGTRIKQWVVDSRREAAWERETCPRVLVDAHTDNTGADCRNLGSVPWMHLNHDCCHACGELHELNAVRADIQEWMARKAKRPVICSDRTKLSDEIAPDLVSFSDSPFFGMLKR